MVTWNKFTFSVCRTRESKSLCYQKEACFQVFRVPYFQAFSYLCRPRIQQIVVYLSVSIILSLCCSPFEVLRVRLSRRSSLTSLPPSIVVWCVFLSLVRFSLFRQVWVLYHSTFTPSVNNNCLAVTSEI